MLLKRRTQWMLLSGLTGAAAARLAEYAITTGWRLTARSDPPEDPADDDVDWKSAAIWTVAAASAVGLSELVARRGAQAMWRRATGRKPPRRRRRKHIRSARAALR